MSAVLLSRLAEHVYWAARYLERAEATARLVGVHTELYLDLPLSAGLGWTPLLAVTGSTEDFDATHADHDEEAVIGYLTIEDANSGSVLQSLSQARFNLRATRALLPRAAWEVLNSLYLSVAERPAAAVDRRTRPAWTAEVIRGCQTLTGVLDGTMNHDEAYGFLLCGRYLERADMTTRVLDVQAELLGADPAGELRPFHDATWNAVLSNLGAQQMFRRTMRTAGVRGPDAIRFLLCDPHFPRSVAHCLLHLSRALTELPRYDDAMAHGAAVSELLTDTDAGVLSAAELHGYIDHLQAELSAVHGRIAATWFTLADQPAPAAATGP